MSFKSPHDCLWQCDITSCRSKASTISHLVEGSERCEHATLVCFHNVSVLDHFIQDDVDSVQVEHDLKMRGGVKETKNALVMLGYQTAAHMEGYVQFTLLGHRQTRWSDTKPKGDSWLSVTSWKTDHAAEVFVQNLDEVVNQLVDGQLVLWRHETDVTLNVWDDWRTLLSRPHLRENEDFLLHCFHLATSRSRRLKRVWIDRLSHESRDRCLHVSAFSIIFAWTYLMNIFKINVASLSCEQVWNPPRCLWFPPRWTERRTGGRPVWSPYIPQRNTGKSREVKVA